MSFINPFKSNTKSLFETDNKWELIFDFDKTRHISEEAQLEDFKSPFLSFYENDFEENNENNLINTFIEYDSKSISKDNIKGDFKAHFAKTFKNSIENEDLEFGMIGNTTELVKKYLDIEREPILEELQNLALSNNKDKRIVYSVIHTFAHLDYDLVYPTGPVFALAMTRLGDVDIQDFAVQCFEMWDEVDSLSYLNNVKIDTPWLNEHLQNIISSIKEENE